MSTPAPKVLSSVETFTPAVRANKVCTARRAKRNDSSDSCRQPEALLLLRGLHLRGGLQEGGGRQRGVRLLRRWQVHAGGEVYGCGVPLLRQIVKVRNNWKYPCLQPTEKAIIARYMLKHRPSAAPSSTA